MIAFLLAAQLASAPCPSVQPSPAWVCQDGGWLPPGHPAIRPPADPTPPAGAPVCDPRPDPYAEPDRAAACSAWDHATRPPAPASVPEYVVDAVYQDRTHMTDFRIVVLSVSRTLEGVPVVTVERVAPVAGQVFSFRIDAPEAQRWERVP